MCVFIAVLNISPVRCCAVPLPGDVEARSYDEHKRHLGDQRQRHETLQWVVVELLVQIGADGMRRGGHVEQVAISRAARDLRCGQGRSGAWLVVDQDGFVRGDVELVSHCAGHDVGSAACRVGYDEADVVGGEGGILGARQVGCECGRQGSMQCQSSGNVLHFFSSVFQPWPAINRLITGWYFSPMPQSIACWNQPSTTAAPRASTPASRASCRAYFRSLRA